MQSHFSSYKLDRIPKELLGLKSPPKRLFFTGDTSLLDISPKVAIIGTRKPNQYTQIQTTNLAKSISQAGGVVVSGGALGVDIIAHSAALPRTIMISPSSLDTIYPASNSKTIFQIATNGLILSEYENNKTPQKYDFLHRNRLVIALSDIVIIPQADKASGSLYSASLALESKKPLFVLSHRIGESLGTQDLLLEEKAEVIFSIEAFLQKIGLLEPILDSASVGYAEILDFCKGSPSFEEAYLRYGEEILALELEGKITRTNGRVVVQ